MQLDENFAFLVLAIVEEIPKGKVITYGKLAEMAGYPRNSRLVGKVLSNSSYYGFYPCHRVVNVNGRTVPGWSQQRSLLENEGVSFKENGNVNLKKHLWV